MVISLQAQSGLEDSTFLILSQVVQLQVFVQARLRKICGVGVIKIQRPQQLCGAVPFPREREIKEYLRQDFAHLPKPTIINVAQAIGALFLLHLLDRSKILAHTSGAAAPCGNIISCDLLKHIKTNSTTCKHLSVLSQYHRQCTATACPLLLFLRRCIIMRITSASRLESRSHVLCLGLGI